MTHRHSAILIGALTAVLLALPWVTEAGNHGNNGNNPNQEILASLARLEAAVERIEDDLASPSTTATFCISQGRGIELGYDWAIESKNEVEGGLGWAEVADVKVVWAPSWPVAMVLPTESGIGLGAGLGRGLDICVEVPITLSPKDAAKLAEIAIDINAKTGDGPFEKGKFQRRAGRIVDYAGRRVPGNQNRVDSFFSQAEEDDAEEEFDRVDAAADSLLDDGIGLGGEGMDVFRDANVRELLATLEMPADAARFLDDPEKLFDEMPDLAGGFDALTCQDLGVSPGMRTRRPRLDTLCGEIESLPSYGLVRDAFGRIDELSDEIVDAVAEVLKPVLSHTGEKDPAETRSRFCSSPIGKRKVFDRYCNRK